MTVSTSEELDLLEARIMQGAEGRWEVNSGRSETLGLHVETMVANPGWEDHWVLIWVTPEKADVRVIYTRDGSHELTEAYELSVDDLLLYLRSLPRPIQTFGARSIYEEVVDET